MFKRGVVALLAAALVGTTGQTAFGVESVAYEWSATLSRLEGEDPLGIGGSEVPFTWRAVVRSDETDTIEVAVRVANYQNAQVLLWLDGFPEPLVSSSAFIEFWDEPSHLPDRDPPGVDIITSRGQFEYQGLSFSLQTGVAVPREAFSFSTSIAAPPEFMPTATTLPGANATSFDAIYLTRTSVDTAVTATLLVPEPTTTALFGLAMVGAFARRRAGRT